MDTQLPPKNETSSRKKFVIWGLGILGSLSILKFVSKKPVAEKTNMVKMLAQDGSLVEVDASKIYCGRRKKVNDEQLQNWVTKK